jgi:hypothetical protein
MNISKTIRLPTSKEDERSMSDHEHHERMGGHGAPEGAPGPGPGGPGYYGYGWPGYGFHPGMGPWAGYPPDAMGPQSGYGPGPMGPPPGYGYGYGGPMGGPGFEQAGPHGPGAGHGHNPSMDEVFEELSNGGGLGGLGKLLDFEDTEFWKGALVGAAAVLLLTNESVQQSLLKSGVKARDAVEKGLGSLRAGGKADSDDEPAEKAEQPAKAGSTKKTRANPDNKKDASS